MFDGEVYKLPLIGAMVAHLIPNQKVACSSHVSGFLIFWGGRGNMILSDNQESLFCHFLHRWDCEKGGESHLLFSFSCSLLWGDLFDTY